MRAFSARRSKTAASGSHHHKKEASYYSSDSDAEVKALEDRNTRSKFFSSLEPRRLLRTPNSIPNKSAMSNYESGSAILAPSTQLPAFSASKTRNSSNQIGSAKTPPNLLIEYQMPCSPEKYLLPIRFPLMYEKIVRNLLKNNKAVKTTAASSDSRSTKFVKQKDNGLTYILLLG